MKLIKPIMAYDKPVTELTFREPTGADLARDGFPYKFESAVRVIDTAAIAKLISSLTNIPPSSVAQMGTLDFTRAMGEVLGFFSDEETPQPSSSTTSS